MPDRVMAWEVWLVSAIPLPPFAAGLVISVALAGVVLAVDAALGIPMLLEHPGGGASLAPGTRSAVVSILLIGYTMGASCYLPCAISRDLFDAGRLDLEADEALTRTRALSVERRVLRASRLTALGAVTLFVVVAVLEPRDAGAIEDGFRGWVLGPLLVWLLARAAHSSLVAARERDTPGARRRRTVDLLDLAPCYIEGRIGLRLALVWLGGSSISSLYFLSNRAESLVVPIMVISATIATLALTLPARRIHAAISTAKREALERVDAELRAARRRTEAGEAPEPGWMADRLAWRAYVAGIREWPFDNPTVIRFALYLLIPIGSWLGGALVERWVSSVLD